MQYDVPLVAQTHDFSCWAASMAMVLGWKNQASYSDSNIAADPGGLSYSAKMNTGLDPSDMYILGRYGFSMEAPQCYNPDGLYSLLSHYGPLWIASSVPGAHVRVITGMEPGDDPTIHINDPWEKGMLIFRSDNKGSQYDTQFSTLMNEMENLGSQELSEATPVYIAHLYI
jgi:hypothetical protein